MRLYNLLDSIRENLGLLKEVNLDRLIDYYAALHAMQIAIQSLIDMTSLVAASLGKPPSSFYEAGEILASEGAFSEEDLAKYRGIVGFRNVLVHNYLEVDRELFREIVETGRYGDIETLALKVLEFAEAREIDP